MKKLDYKRYFWFVWLGGWLSVPLAHVLQSLGHTNTPYMMLLHGIVPEQPCDNDNLNYPYQPTSQSDVQRP